jgi:ribosomal protein L17
MSLMNAKNARIESTAHRQAAVRNDVEHMIEEAISHGWTSARVEGWSDLRQYDIYMELINAGYEVESKEHNCIHMYWVITW